MPSSPPPPPLRTHMQLWTPRRCPGCPRVCTQPPNAGRPRHGCMGAAAIATSLGPTALAPDHDPVVGPRPTALANRNGHSRWLNTAALPSVGDRFHNPDASGRRNRGRGYDMLTGVVFETLSTSSPLTRAVPMTAGYCTGGTGEPNTGTTRKGRPRTTAEPARPIPTQSRAPAHPLGYGCGPARRWRWTLAGLPARVTAHDAVGSHHRRHSGGGRHLAPNLRRHRRADVANSRMAHRDYQALFSGDLVGKLRDRRPQRRWASIRAAGPCSPPISRQDGPGGVPDTSGGGRAASVPTSSAVEPPADV